MYMKSRTRESKVEEFHKAFNLDIGSQARESLLDLRMKLIQEEANEVSEALKDILLEVHYDKKVPKLLWESLIKELCDLQYVLSGTLVSIKELYNVDFDVAFNRVHQSNMSKLDNDGKAIYNEYGKVQKSQNYKEPELGDLF